jgi:hypothetical protein
MIKMEDLVLHTKQGTSLFYNSEQDLLKQTPELPFSFEIKGKSLWLGVCGSLFLLVGVFLLNQEYEKKEKLVVPQLKVNETSSHAPTFVISPVSPSHLEEAILGDNAPRNELPLAPSNNSTGHSNELLLEEYKKHLQMRMEKENADAAQIMEVIKAREEASEEDEAEDDSARKKKKKRKTASESEEESGSEAE